MRKILLRDVFYLKKSFLKAHTVWFYMGFIFFVCGCATTSPSGVVGRAMMDIRTVQVGMSHQEVKNLLGDKVTTGYEITNDNPPQPKPIFLKNPFRVELYRTDDKVYEVAFYFTTLKHQDGMITDDELTPLVFENDHLIGRGWEFYTNLKKENRL